MRLFRQRRTPGPGACLAPSAPAPIGAVEVETEIGPLWMHESDEVILPILRQQGVWEPAESAFMRATLATGMTVLDIGAHVGYFTILAAQSVGSNGHVIAFEPNPDSYRLLCANVWRHGLRNVTAFPVAVGREEEDLTLHLSDTNSGDHRVIPTEDDRRKIAVRAIPIDLLAPSPAPVDFVKVDTQGNELAVLQGMHAVLRNSPSIILTVEFWPFGLRRAGCDPHALLGAIMDMGLRITELDPAGSGPVPFDANAVLARCEAGGDHAHTNLLLGR
jgi:FkbM family methyltransferase